MRTEKRSSPQISGDMVSLYNIMSPQNGDTRGRPPPPPSDATASIPIQGKFRPEAARNLYCTIAT